MLQAGEVALVFPEPTPIAPVPPSKQYNQSGPLPGTLDGKSTKTALGNLSGSESTAYRANFMVPMRPVMAWGVL
jgi:hypothetical protein